MDNDATGAIIGLTVEKGFMDVYQAMMEGICYESRVSLELLRQAGITLDTMRATGGGSRSMAWNQMKADIWRVTLDTLSVQEAGTVGSIMLAGLATDAYGSLEQAMAMTDTAARFTPSADADRFDAPFARYRRVYEAVRPLQERL